MAKNMTYAEQIKHPKWQQKRLEVLEAYGFTCEECRSIEKELHVHHKIYRRNRMAWEYELEEYSCLCKDCHKEETELDDAIKEALSLLSRKEKTQLLGYSHAINDPLQDLSTKEKEYLSGFFDRIRSDNAMLFMHINS